MSHLMRRFLSSYQKWIPLLLGLLALAGLYVISRYSFLLFHSLAEAFSIIVATAVFVIFWNTRHLLQNDIYLVIGFGCLFAGLFDIIYIFAYPGMAVFPTSDGGNLALQAKTVAQSYVSFSCVAAFAFLRRKVNQSLTLLIYSIISVIALLAIYPWRVFPDCYISGVGITPFANGALLLNSFGYLVVLGLLVANRRYFGRRVFWLLILPGIAFFLQDAISSMAMEMDDFSRTVAHLCQVIALYFVYQAFVVVGLRNPYDLLFQSQQRNAESLDRQRRFLEAVLENIHSGIIVCDANGRFTLFNRAVRDSFGGHPEDFPVEKWREYYDVYCSDGKTRMSLHELPLFRALRREHVRDVELMIVSKTGTARTFMVSGEPLIDKDGLLQGAVIALHDITERKRSEVELKVLNEHLEQRVAERSRALAESEERLRRLGDNLPQSAVYQYIHDFDGTPRFLYVSAGIELLCGVKIEDVLRDSSTVHRLILPEYLTALTEAEAVSKRDLSVINMEVQMRRTDGKVRWMHIRSRPHRMPDGRVEWDGVQTDITVRKKAQEELAAAKAAAEQANRTKDHFLAVLSHELRTPLTPVVMAASMLQDIPNLDPTVHETLETIHRNIELEARLIDDLLDVSRIAQGKIELHRSRVELGTIIERAVEVCRPDIEARQLQFGVDLGPAGSYWVDADVTRLQQVFWNLLKNAVKFTPRGGCVGIRCLPDGTHVVIEVNDSGIGIEPEAILRIFNAFEQVEHSVTLQFGGLGLGLAISKALVEMHGGTIDVQSAGLGKGSTFRVRLPLTTPAHRPEALLPATPPQHAVHPLRILLVEDHGVTAKMMTTVLSQEGHSVKTASDVATGLEMANQNDFDLLMSDLGLPDGSGHDLMRQLRERGYKFPGIALSGYGQEEDIQRSREAGFAIHLIKPASREAVLAAVASVAAGQRADIGAETAMSQPGTPVFDVQTALDRCLGKQELLNQMIEFFFTDVEDLLPRLRSALERGDLTEMGKLAHRLKDTLIHLAAERARDAASRVESIGLGRDQPSEAKEAVHRLEQECQLLMAALEGIRGIKNSGVFHLV